MASPASFAKVWQETIDEAGIDTETKGYLLARTISRVGTVALLAKDIDDFHAKVTDRFITGDTIAGTTYKANGNTDVLRACMAHLFEECTLLYAAHRQPGPSVAAPSQLPAPTVAAAVSSKAPKELPPGIWNQQILRYNQVTVGGSNRKFPETMLLGAECVLARLWWEHTSSKSYSPVKLGEVISKRSFTATGEVNMLAVSRKEKTARQLVLADDDTIGTAEEDIFDPRSNWAVTDALESIKWAFIFIDLGTEESIETWFSHFNKLLRTRPRFIDCIRAWWDAASWRICMEMRSGTTFDAAVASILVDIVWQHEHLFSKMLSGGKGFKPDDAQQSGGESPAKRTRSGSKGQGRNDISKGLKSKGSTVEFCRKFNLGTCTASSCRYQHVCGTCLKTGHTSAQCWQKETQQQTKPKGKGKKGKKGKKAPQQQTAAQG